ncbi:hypothetical protein LINPERHAP2_LOCUS34587 [Linum perenne]
MTEKSLNFQETSTRFLVFSDEAFTVGAAPTLLEPVETAAAPTSAAAAPTSKPAAAPTSKTAAAPTSKTAAAPTSKPAAARCGYRRCRRQMLIHQSQLSAFEATDYLRHLDNQPREKHTVAAGAAVAGRDAVAATLSSFLSLLNPMPASRKFSSSGLNYIKSVRIVSMSIQIVVGALDSLETLSLCLDEEIICSSLLPSLKSLQVISCYSLTGCLVGKIISKSPSLLSLHLVSTNGAEELNIESPTLEKLELDWDYWPFEEMMLHIDAPSLVSVRFSGRVEDLRAISDVTNSFQAVQIRSCTFELSLNCRLIATQNFKELKDLLSEMTRQFQFIELKLHGISLVSSSKDWDQVEDDSPTPVVERVEVEPYTRLDRTFMYNMLWSCQPKYVSFVSFHSGFYSDFITGRLSYLKLINEVFMERTSPNCEKIA